MSLSRHDPPGFVDDLTEANKKGWSDLISSFMLTENVSSTLTPQFYDATKVVEINPVQIDPITWFGFPKLVKLQNPNDNDRWRVADSDRIHQDEYLEWSIKRDANGTITKIVFCNEGPEYYEFLAKHQPDTLLRLYQKLNPDAPIKIADLFKLENGKLVYDKINKWNSSTNTGTIMHLIQKNNTLGAEVDLGARATVLRKRADGTPITDSDELIRCSRYGNPDRNSDPNIGAGINAGARGTPQIMLTIANPVGLYIDSINWGLIDPPAGHEDDDLSQFWKYTRGNNGKYMRAEFEIPKDKGYVLGDITVNGKPLQYGGQLADYIKISITARASALQLQSRFCSEAPPPVPPKCKCPTPVAANDWTLAMVTEEGLPGLANHSSVRYQED
ncbi:hypothetical protein BDZ94DRAFT_1239063 [Collybia nuda]|uniref:Uncharacterized protein n=1 Tax=Collybia nuda TaxID=64659 RepID=A0A9P5Y1N2_9AGAR|nr:hypothetical protein BDZ94DRAFT_1239063 [Collybia nuda]